MTSRVLGGAIQSRAERFSVFDSKFIMNDANIGGALNVAKNFLKTENFMLIRGSYFIGNNAGPISSSINFFNDLLDLQAIIINTVIMFNDCKCKNPFFTSKLKK